MLHDAERVARLHHDERAEQAHVVVLLERLGKRGVGVAAEQGLAVHPAADGRLSACEVAADRSARRVVHRGAVHVLVWCVVPQHVLRLDVERAHDAVGLLEQHAVAANRDGVRGRDLVHRDEAGLLVLKHVAAELPGAGLGEQHVD
eukprot:365340-Chlamydomonas_euryale.AAC.4